MEPNRMEEEFRKKLNAREIQPSDAAWDRLDAMLSVAENKKPKRNFSWLYMAAGLVLFLGAGLFLMQQEENSQTLPIESSGSVVAGEEMNKVGKGVSEDLNRTDSAIFNPQTTTEVLADNQSNNSQTSKLTQKGRSGALPEVRIDKVPVLQEELPNVIENKNQEPEKMLAVAETPKEKPKVKVNANSLLSSVEGELNEEFRETTLDKVKKKFETVKTAVVNRNYE